MFGLDYTSEPVQIIKALNPGFVCRYTGYFSGYDTTNVALQQGKCLYTAEADTLLANNIDIVSNFEWYSLRPSINNAGSAAAANGAGQWDARVGNAIHIGCGGPVDAPIYFSVDYQTDGSDTVDYFKGVASVIGLPRVGAYGGFDCIKFLFDNNLITYGWQTYAWSNGQWDPRAHIHQYSNGNKIAGGGTVDFNESMKSYFGSWKGRKTMIPQGWTDDGTTLTAPNGITCNTGFRNWVLNNNWDASNIPLAPDYSLNPVTSAWSGIGQGSRQDFAMLSLGWTTTLSVFVIPLGEEFAALKAQPVPQPISDPLAVAAHSALKAWLAEP